MIYKPIQGTVRVGKLYDPSYRGIHFCCEASSDGLDSFSKESIKDLSIFLRENNVHPMQIDNTGTDNPFPSSPLREENLSSLLRFISRPIVVVCRLPEGDSCQIEIDERISSKRRLYEALILFNHLGFKSTDLKLLQQTDFGYIPMNKEDKDYILSGLKK